MLTNLFKTETKKDDFSKRIKILIKNLSNKKIILFGLGEETEILFSKYGLKKLNIIAVSDNKDVEWQPENINFIKPEDINSLEYDYILIAQDNLLRAERFLTEEINIEKEKLIRIITTDIFDEKIHLEYLKRINFQKQINKLSKKLRDKKIIIYGANSFSKCIFKNFDLSKLNILAVADMKYKMKKENEKFLNYDVCSAYEIENYKPDYVLVGEKFLTNEIIELLKFTSINDTNIKIIPIFKKPLFAGIYNVITNRNVYLPVKPSIKIRFLRLINYLSNRYFETIKYNTYSGYDIPQSIRLEACTLCQLNCASCYMRKYNHDAVGDGWLKFEDFKNFVDNNPNIKEVSLANSGEIFLNPQLFEILEYAYSKNIKLNAMTGVNLNTLSDKVAEGLVKYKFDYMTISIDGASQETYKQYRRNGNFDKVIDNIRTINFYKEKYNSQYPKLKWQFILFNHNEHEIIKAKELAKELNVNLFFTLPWGDTTYIPKDAELVKRETGLKYASVKESQNKTKTKRALNLCKRMFTAPQVNYDGNLLGCCILFREHLGVNIFKIGFEKALKSAEFQYSIRMLRGELPPVLSNPCTYCNEYNSMTYNNSYFNSK